MKGITKRDVREFLLGMLAMFVIELVADWRGNVEAFNRDFVRGLNQ